MQSVRYVRIDKYWLKIMKCNDTRFTKIVYKVLLCDALEKLAGYLGLKT